ncbi:MAG: transposase [Tenuifilaceae bacterium]|nr:transposase [Tenuifilaceae bacterium]
MPNRTKYNQKVVKQICDLIEGGKHSITEICSLVGISRRVFYKWEKETAQFAVSIARARVRAMEKENEQMKVLSLRGMRILLQGGFLKQVETKTAYGKNGEVTHKEITTTLKYFGPCFKTIMIVLNNKDTVNWSTRLKRHVNYHTKRLNTEANRVGAQVITLAEAASFGMDSLKFESNVEHKP